MERFLMAKNWLVTGLDSWYTIAMRDVLMTESWEWEPFYKNAYLHTYASHLHTLLT